MGIIIAYHAHLELSSKEKVVTIIILHKMPQMKIYAPTPEVGIKATANTASINSIDFVLCPILYKSFNIRLFISPALLSHTAAEYRQS